MGHILPRPGFGFLWFLAALFLLLGLGYSLLTPVFENSDETLHYPFIKHLADGQGLPIAAPGQLWNQEGTQPPLYYALVAASTFWINSDNLPELLQRNPHWLFTEVRALINDNQNLVLHGPMDAFPYRRAALAVHLGRGWSLLFGLLTVIFTFLLTRYLFPRNLPLALTATALTALNPQFLRVSATVSNDTLSAALTTLAVLLAFRFSDSANQRISESASLASPLRLFASSPLRLFVSSPPLLLGLLAGLAVLAKLSTLSIVVVIAFIIFLRLFFISELHEAPLRHTLRWLIIMGVTLLAVTGWWFWRNYSLYGEWFATETHLNLAGRNDISPAQAWSLRAEAERAYWATFGWGQIRPPEWIYGLLFRFTRLGLLGLGLALLGKLVQGDKSRPLPLNLADIHFAPIFTLLLWAGLNLLLYLRWVMEVGSVSHTRLIFPAIAALSLLLALGWHALLPRRWAGPFSGVVIAAFLALNIYSLGWLIYPAFRVSEAANGRISESATLDYTFLGALKLSEGQVGADLASAHGGDHRESSTTTGEVVMVKVQWQTLASLDKNYSVAAVLLAPDGSVLARRETYPGLGLRPTRYLPAGDSFWDVYPLKLTEEVSEPLVARATVNLFDFDSAERAGFPALNSQGTEVTPVVGEIKVVPRAWPEYQPNHSTQVKFADVMSLIGYDLERSRGAGPQDTRKGWEQGSRTPEKGESGEENTVKLTLYWQSLAPVDKNYVVFVHLLDSAGQVITQADGPPAGNAYPTRWWSPGEIIADRRSLPAAPGFHSLRLGWYDLDSGQRLAITASDLPQQDNSIELILP
ncbi:MAG: hypothetical protein U0401_31220 [Anaerolineae bacterium]